MTNRTLFTAISFVALCAALPSASLAKEIRAIPPEKLKKQCTAGGGINLPKQPGRTGTWGCVAGNGTITLCGGQTPQQQKTCTQARVAGESEQASINTRLSRHR